MTDETLETLAEEWSDVTVESEDDRISYGDGTTVYINDPVSVQINGHSIDLQDATEESTIESTEEAIYIQSYPSEEPIEVVSVQSNTERSRASLSASDLRNLWTVKIGQTEYTVLFPDGADLYILDGYLINRSSNNITGVVIDSSLSTSSYFHYTITILPFASSNTQNTVYRYGSRSYLTEYSVGTGYNLATSVSYGDVKVVHRPYGWSLSPSDLVICGILLFSVLVSIIGGLVRR